MRRLLLYHGGTCMYFKKYYNQIRVEISDHHIVLLVSLNLSKGSFDVCVVLV